MTHKAVCVCATICACFPVSVSQAQDVDVPGNLILRGSTATEGNILKGGSPFIHNFGTDNTCVGAGAGNLTMTGDGSNTAVGANALSNNKAGAGNTAIGAYALNSLTSGTYNTANGARALSVTNSGHANTGTGFGALNP
jgi:trimeric autotransporter adhesin